MNTMQVALTLGVTAFVVIALVVIVELLLPLVESAMEGFKH